MISFHYFATFPYPSGKYLSWCLELELPEILGVQGSSFILSNTFGNLLMQDCISEKKGKFDKVITCAFLYHATADKFISYILGRYTRNKEDSNQSFHSFHSSFHALFTFYSYLVSWKSDLGIQYHARVDTVLYTGKQKVRSCIGIQYHARVDTVLYTGKQKVRSCIGIQYHWPGVTVLKRVLNHCWGLVQQNTIDPLLVFGPAKYLYTLIYPTHICIQLGFGPTHICIQLGFGPTHIWIYLLSLRTKLILACA